MVTVPGVYNAMMYHPVACLDKSQGRFGNCTVRLDGNVDGNTDGNRTTMKERVTIYIVDGTTVRRKLTIYPLTSRTCLVLDQSSRCPGGVINETDHC